MNKIKNSLEWNAVESILYQRAHTLKHGDDVIKMIGNIRIEITELSKAEVLGRQGQRHLVEDKLAKVNSDIEVVEEFLLVAALLG